MGDELLLKHSLDKHQRLVIVSSIYLVWYSGRKNLGKPKHIHQFISTAWWWETSFSWNIVPINIKGLSRWTAFIMSNTVAEIALIDLNAAPIKSKACHDKRHCVWHDKCRLSRQAFDLYRATFWQKLVSHHQAVNEADSSLLVRRIGSKSWQKQ